MKITFPKHLAKFLVALAGLAGEAVTLGVVPQAEVKWVSLAVAIITSVGVYLIPNAPAPVMPVPPPAKTLP